jgi:hypothetical protein
MSALPLLRQNFHPNELMSVLLGSLLTLLCRESYRGFRVSYSFAAGSIENNTHLATCPSAFLEVLGSLHAGVINQKRPRPRLYCLESVTLSTLLESNCPEWRNGDGEIPALPGPIIDYMTRLCSKENLGSKGIWIVSVLRHVEIRTRYPHVVWGLRSLWVGRVRWSVGV